MSTDEPGEEEKREPWEIAEPAEGFDVFGYDAARAKRMHRIVLGVYIVAFVILGYGLVAEVVVPQIQNWLIRHGQDSAK